MQLSHNPKTSDRFGRYYTDKFVAETLIKNMDNSAPKLIMDLGVGSGALVEEASKRWSSAHFVTVDIDKNIGSPKLYGLNKSPSHHVIDALASRLSQKIGVKLGTVDAALCNPPYINPKWKKHFGEMLEDAGFSDLFPKVQSVPAEILFLAQNLRFLKIKGKLGLILPDGVISGQRFSKLRNRLATEHRLERIIELPRRVFKNTDAKAHIVVLSKNAQPANFIKIQRLETNGILSPEIHIDPCLATSRLDYSYLFFNANIGTSEKKIFLRDIVVKIFRGKYSSKDIQLVDFPVFHTTDFPTKCVYCHKSFAISKIQSEQLSSPAAEDGDILIARVGRNLEQKICMVNQCYVAVSDSVFILRVEKAYREVVFNYFCSETGRNTLSSKAQGVGAQFLTYEAILSIAINL